MKLLHSNIYYKPLLSVVLRPAIKYTFSHLMNVLYSVLYVQLRIHKFAFLNSMKGNALSSLWCRGNKSKLTCAFVFILVDDSRPRRHRQKLSNVFIHSFYLSPVLLPEDYDRTTIYFRDVAYTRIFTDINTHRWIIFIRKFHTKYYPEM